MRHDLRVRRVKLADLRQHPDNPRNGDIEMLAESLHVNGQFKPIVITPDGTILAGNHTYAAALSLDWRDIAAVTVQVDPTSTEAKRIMLADNRSSDHATYDPGQLLDLLDSLPELSGTGFTDDDLTALLTQMQRDMNTALSDTICPSCGRRI